MPVVALVLAAGAALAGCSGDGSAAPAPLPSIASPTPALVPSPPALASEDSPQGAAAFAGYFVEAISAAFASGDAAAVRALSDPECGGCNNFVDAIEEPLPPGERVEGGALSVVFAESPPVDGGDVIVTIRYAIEEVRVVGDSGDVIRTTPAEPAIDAEMRLIRTGNSWRVMGFRSADR